MDDDERHDPPAPVTSLPLRVISSDGVPTNTAYLISFLGRDPECKAHTPGRPHPPCWSMAKVEFDDDQAMTPGT